MTLSKNAFWAVVIFALLPDQAYKAGSCKALAKENVIGQGKGPHLVMAAKLMVACSGVWPPDRNTIPASSFGTWLRNTSAVVWPIFDEVG